MWKLMRKEEITTVTEKIIEQSKDKKMKYNNKKGKTKRKRKYVMEMKAGRSLVNFELKI